MLGLIRDCSYIFSMTIYQIVKYKKKSIRIDIDKIKTRTKHLIGFTDLDRAHRRRKNLYFGWPHDRDKY